MNTNGNILIVEDELITAESIENLLEEEGYQVVGIARDAETAFQLFSKSESQPEVVICDINIRGEMKGTELAEKLSSMYGCEIIFLTAYSDSNTLGKAFASAPVMYLLKPYNDTQLLVAVQMAYHRIINKVKPSLSQKLDITERESEIAWLIAKGMSSKQVARHLNISIETVKTHRRRMLQKNNINNFAQLVYLLSRDA